MPPKLDLGFQGLDVPLRGRRNDEPADRIFKTPQRILNQHYSASRTTAKKIATEDHI
jgi:hypothetical protein